MVESDYGIRPGPRVGGAHIAVIKDWDPDFPPWHDELAGWPPVEIGRLSTPSLPIIATALGEIEEQLGAAMLLIDGVGSTEPFRSLMVEMGKHRDLDGAAAMTELVHQWRAEAYHCLARWRRHESTVVVIRDEPGTAQLCRAATHCLPFR